MVAVEAIKPSYEIDPSKSANTKAMFATAVDLTSSSEGMDEAKQSLDASISKMMAEPDPFMQMMIAIYEVIPGTLLYKEEKLVYDTEAFEFVTQLNNHMTTAMSYYSKAGDYVAESGAGTPNEYGSSTSGASTTWGVWGLEAGDAYMKEMEDLKALVANSSLPTEIIAAMDSAFAKISVANSSSLWNGLAGAYRVSGDTYTHHQCEFNDKGNADCGQWKQVKETHSGGAGGEHFYQWLCNTSGKQGCASYTQGCYSMFGEHISMGGVRYDENYNCNGHTVNIPGEYGKYNVTVGESDWTVGYNGDLVDEGYSHSSRRVSTYQTAVDSSTTGNLELQTTINSYSATVEAEFMFDMEQYNTYANTDAQIMRGHIDQVGASVTRLTNISHA